MNTAELSHKALLASKHFSKILFWESGYCIAVFFAFKGFPLILQKNLISGNQILFPAYCALLVLVPLCFNLFQIVRYSWHKDYLRRSNYILAEMLLLIFVFWFLIR